MSNNEMIGHFDLVDGGIASGWALNKQALDTPVKVQISLGKEVVGEGYANLPRPDLSTLGIEATVGGFHIPLSIKSTLRDQLLLSAKIVENGMVLPGGPILLMPKSRFCFFIDGFISSNVISGWLKDLANPANLFIIQLLEGDQVVSVAKNNESIDDTGCAGRFTFHIADTLLDGNVHKFTFRLDDFDWNFETRSFLTPTAHGGQSGNPYSFLDESIWDDVPAVKLSRKHRLATTSPKSPIETQIENLQKVLTKTPDENIARRYDLICQIGYSYMHGSQTEDALSHFKKAIILDGNSSKAFIACADTLLRAGRESEAEIWLRKALKKIPGEPQLLSRLDKILATRHTKSTQLIAFYLPQFHPTPENDQWWGKGFTEWTNVAAATPLFHGHLQPRRPTALGYYDLRLPESVNAQFELAGKYGIDAFCYYYYWFDGKRILDRPLQDLVDGKTGPFPFCICWANEDWTRSWDGQSGEILIAQNHTPESDFRFIQDVAPLLRHPDYVRLEGKPVLLIYRANKLAEPKKTAKAWRDWCRSEGIGEIHLCAVQSFGFDDPRPLGFDAAVEFPPHSVHEKYPATKYYEDIPNVPLTVERFTGRVFNYQTYADAFINRPREPYRLHRGCFLAWDNTARRGKTAHIYNNFSIGKYRQWLAHSASIGAKANSDSLMFINAWNEWAEGTVLEPDSFYGYGLLEATRQVKAIIPYAAQDTFWLNGAPRFYFNNLEESQRIIMVGHDAHPHGAQINLLHMARCLKRDLRMEVVLLLLEGGAMVADYERVCTTIVLGKNEGWHNTLAGLLQHYFSLGTNKAICNTVVTGDVAQILHGHGYQVVSLVHELPAIIQSHGLQSVCWQVAGNADNIVFASKVVADEFRDRYWPDPERILIAPQGVAFNPYIDKRQALRTEVREELDLPSGIRLVVGCGYGDIRKGIDLFVQMAGEVSRMVGPETVAFVWIGSIDPNMLTYINADLRRLDLEDRFFVTGITNNTARYYIAADIYALTSREDPFPSVVMEAFDAGLPVVAFNDGGGYVDIVNDLTGALVPYLDVSAMSGALTKFLNDSKLLQATSKYVHQFSRQNFSYPTYMRKLLALLDGVPAKAVAKGILQRSALYDDATKPSITVIVPNYNYGRYLELRLRTIFDQTLQPDEIIILDDASTDYSMEIIEAMIQQCTIPIHIVRNESNTGNPFVQWAKGLAQAKGDLIWIAEADDYCEPTLLETLARELVDESIVMAWSDSVIVDGEGKSEGFEYKNYYAKESGSFWHAHFVMEGRELIERCLLTANVVPNASAVLFRRSAVDSDLALIQQYRFSGDWWFWISVAEKGRVSYRTEPLNYHRRHAQSVMGDVLREGTKLIPETIAFYQRLAIHKPECLTPQTKIDILMRLENLFRMFPKMQFESECLKDHPDFFLQHKSLTEQLDIEAALKFIHNVTDATLVLAQDVLNEGATIQLVKYLQGKHNLQLVVVGEEEAAEALIKAADVERNACQIIVSKTPKGIGAKTNVKARKLVSSESKQADPLVELTKYLRNPTHVFSHGLAAHVLVEKLGASKYRKWSLVGGKEFDALLGKLPEGKEVTIAGLALSIQRSDALLYIGDRPSHPFGRLALLYRRPLDRLDPAKVLARVKKFDSHLYIGVAARMLPEQWADEIALLAQKREQEKVDIRLRLLVMAEDASRIKAVVQGVDFVELVWIYEKPNFIEYNPAKNQKNDQIAISYNKL